MAVAVALKKSKSYNAIMKYYIVIGICFAFFMTLLGSSLIFLFKKEINKKLNTIFFGLSSGIMFAATIWSLLIPSLERSEYLGKWNFLPACVGILLGSLFFVLLDFIVKLVNRKKKDGAYKLSSSMRIFLAVTIHNIPEGLAIGFAFGVALINAEAALYVSALSLAIGIGIQNFPEGLAIALPLKKELKSTSKTFLLCFISALIEPIASVVGLFLAYSISSLLPYILSFAAGAMIYVIVEELMPETTCEEHKTLGTWCFIIGFIVMLILDVALG